ncbi:NuoM family protein [Blastopirellula marina]|uniref:NADH-quinone oxidoreductase subunit M n=1 Tax=Blastopirellula marina TaxID=124 RepID=A0A2S8FNJ9_9BACT|nr:NADH-quinone oxidoreductase subunit M [Blastopirellula marina]PQO33749.1 NADH-quinone oxidoreductase subunit M [Blastopirellula marina]PTL43536.1 NADH-quinone oxidoreductase subunit M [Blastopirellula marina]
MDNLTLIVVTSLIFTPVLGAVVLLCFPAENKPLIRWFTLLVTLLVMLPTLWMALPYSEQLSFQTELAGVQQVIQLPWIPSFDIQFFLGIDGISFPLLMLTAVISFLAMGASWTIEKHVKSYCVLYLLLLAGMMGVFLSLDFFLFYIFWEVMLLPMYFLIGVWGGPRKEYAAIKFFLYTLFGSVLMLIAVLMLYFNSDLRQLSADQLDIAHVAAWDEAGDLLSSETYKQQLDELKYPVHTFNILALQQLGQHTDVFDQALLAGKSIQWWAFVLLFVGFAIKVPSVPLHTWLPDAHVEAPTPISMILAGVLLKMGGYGIVRICYPICPDAGYDLVWFVCSVGVISMVYGAFAALAQKDFKRMVAYSSVSHMGYVVLGLGVWSATIGNVFDPISWSMGVKGALFQMIGHGISSAGMFFMVGVIYDRVHHRELDKFGGLYGKMPVYTAMAMLLFFAGLGLPGLCGFIGEAFVVLSVWKLSGTLAVIAAAVVILTAGYILWAIQRVCLGPEYRGPHEDELSEITPREFLIALPLCVLAVVLGVFPATMFRYMDSTVDQQIADLNEWTEEVKYPRLRAEREAAQEAEVAAKE